MKQSLIAVTLASLFASNVAIAEDDVEVITITATRATNTIMKPLASQIVIDREQIELAQVESVTELLSRYAGIDVAVNGGRGQNASVFIRGASSDQTLVLIDGLRVNSATNGGATWSTISPNLIERIEVVKGPRAAVWGSDAIGGVINIITRQNAPGKIGLAARYGTNDTQSYVVSGGIAHGKGSTSISVNHESSDGFDVLKSNEPDEDGYDNLSLAINGSQRVTEALDISWLLRASDQDSDFDSTYLNRGENENREWRLAAEYDWTVAGNKNTTLASFGTTRDRNLTYRTDGANGVDNNRPKSAGDLFETRRDQLSVINTTHFSNAFTLALGADLYDEKVVSTTDFADKERSVEGYFAHGLWQQDKISAELALRYDDVENINSESTYNASFGYQFTDAIQVSLLKGTGFKAPTFNDLYFPFGGNPDLLSETSDTDEIVLNYTRNAFTMALSWYQNDIENLIEWAPDANGVWQPRNIANADIEGVDLNLSYSGAGGEHAFNLGYLDAVDKASGSPLVRRAKNQYGYQFTTNFGATDLMLSYEYKGKRYDRGNELSSYQLVDISLEHKLTDDFSAQLKLNNLFDEEYETVFDYNVEGRAVYVGLTYQM